MNLLALKPSELLPHRAPMLLVDKVIHTDFDKNITVEKTVTEDSIFFQGHFPGYPLLPGVIMIEMMFQTCGVLNRLVMEQQGNAASKKGQIGKAVKVKSATFFKEVFPDTKLTIKAEKLRSVFRFSEYKAKVYAGDEKVCEAELTVTI